MMDIFDELLEKTGGYPDDQKADLQNTVDTLEAIGLLARADLQREVQEIIENLPEVRRQRAAQMRDQAIGLPAKEKQYILDDADRLEKSAEKLRSPDATEQFRNRAALTELSIRLKARVAGVEKMLPELDPERLSRFDKAMRHLEEAMPSALTHKDRHQMALYALATELRATTVQHFDLAVDNLYMHTVGADQPESGHLNDVSRDAAEPGAADEMIPKGAHTQDYLKKLLDDEDFAEHQAWVAQNKLLTNMPKIAAECLKPAEYAAYRVMTDNEHLIDWKLQNGKLVMRAKTLDAEDQENTIGKILHRDLHYEHIRGANLLVKTTLEKLGSLIREHGGKDLTPSQRATERMGKSTAEIVADPSAQARKRVKGVEI